MVHYKSVFDVELQKSLGRLHAEAPAVDVPQGQNSEHMKARNEKLEQNLPPRPTTQEAMAPPPFGQQRIDKSLELSNSRPKALIDINRK